MVSLLGFGISIGLAVGFFIFPNIAAKIFGLLPLAIAVNGAYAFWKNEQWAFEVSETAITWSYPRMPRDSGTILLRDIAHLTIDDTSVGSLTVLLHSGKRRRVNLVSGGRGLRDYLAKHHADLPLTFIPSKD